MNDPATNGDTMTAAQAAAQAAARRDRERQLFVVRTDSGQAVVTKSRALAVEMAQRTNGAWTRCS